MIRPIRKSYTCRQKNTRLGSVRGWGTEPGFVLSPGGTGERGASLNSRNNLFRARNLEKKRTGTRLAKHKTVVRIHPNSIFFYSFVNMIRTYDFCPHEDAEQRIFP